MRYKRWVWENRPPEVVLIVTRTDALGVTVGFYVCSVKTINGENIHSLISIQDIQIKVKIRITFHVLVLEIFSLV